jgi:LuxR family quorum-sensing system transcriptional regulator CciR
LSVRTAARDNTGRRLPAVRPKGQANRARGGSTLIDHFQDRASQCVSAGDLRLLLADAAHELGYPYFALLHHNSLREGWSNLIRLDNYPSSWERELLDRVMIANDPIHEASLRTNVGFQWEDLGKLVPPNHAHKAILHRARYFGITNGFTVPANVPGEPSGSCSFAGRTRTLLSRSTLQYAELVGAHAFHAARRIHGYTSVRTRPHLSRREWECLRLLAAGKTDWEIATILGLSPETVHQYVKQARAAYDVVSRTQLVVNGLRDAWISYDDALRATLPEASPSVCLRSCQRLRRRQRDG